MTDQELLDWYENNKTTKPADMSGKDYEMQMNNALRLKKQNALQQNYNMQQSAINKEQSIAQQNASISNQQLMKYLEKYQISNGVAKGQASSDYIKANNAYNVNRATIANNAQTQRNSLDYSYNQDKLANEEDAYNNQIDIIDKYRQQDIEDQARKREEEQWQLEMDAYRKGMEYEAEDRETAKQATNKAEQEQSDADWTVLAQDRINAMYEFYQDKDGKLTDDEKQKILQEIEKYKTKLYDDESYEKLLEWYRTNYYDEDEPVEENNTNKETEWSRRQISNIKNNLILRR